MVALSLRCERETEGMRFEAQMLPADWRAGRFLGRVATPDGPTPVLLADGTLFDMTPAAPTVSELVERRAFDPTRGRPIAPLEELSLASDGDAEVRLLSP